jgi:hypothetical protein
MIPDFNPKPFQSIFDPRTPGELNLGGGGWGSAGQYSMGGAGGAGGFQLPGADMSSLLSDYGGFGGQAFGGAGGAPAGGGGLFSSFLQNTAADGSTSGGYGMAGLQVANGAYNMYKGYQDGKRADEMFEFAKEDANRQWGAKKSDTNRRLSDRQDMRQIDNPGGSAMETGAYMDKWGVK